MPTREEVAAALEAKLNDLTMAEQQAGDSIQQAIRPPSLRHSQAISSRPALCARPFVLLNVCPTLVAPQARDDRSRDVMQSRVQFYQMYRSALPVRPLHDPFEFPIFTRMSPPPSVAHPSLTGHTCVAGSQLTEL